MRVYLPATLSALAELHKTGRLSPAPLTAYAVTPALREWYTEGDSEELEYAAMTDAARASLRLLADAPDAPRRRVVIAAEVPDAQAVPLYHGSEPGLVRVSAEVPLSWVASLHVDDPAVLDEVALAVVLLGAAEAGDEDAVFTVDGIDDHELLWYATQELPDLLG
ncbi:DUF6912 family protein [Catenulispora subtropica]|uniref:Uncharacterized protein n=1 Tax=Catenulispora subtropica TaxID=450798 RepID=A0ABP5CG98_9ACTN